MARQASTVRLLRVESPEEVAASFPGTAVAALTMPADFWTASSGCAQVAGVFVDTLALQRSMQHGSEVSVEVI